MNKTILACVIVILITGCAQREKNNCGDTEYLSLYNKPVTYHFAGKRKTSKGYEYTYYIHVDSKGNLKFVSKTGLKYPFMEPLVEQIDKKGFKLETRRDVIGETIGVKLAKDRSVPYKKGDKNFQDALRIYLKEIGNLYFLMEVCGETKNLNPLFNVISTDDHVYVTGTLVDEHGDEIPQWYIHGVTKPPLPVMPSSGSDETLSPQCPQEQ